MDITLFTEAVTLAKSAISLLRGAKDLLPDSKEKEEATRLLGIAEREFKISEAKAASELGYEICRCTWPPQIMIETEKEYIVQCPQCKKTKDIKPRVHASCSSLKDHPF